MSSVSVCVIVIGLPEYRQSVIVVGPVAVQSWSAEGVPSLFNRTLADDSRVLILLGRMCFTCACYGGNFSCGIGLDSRRWRGIEHYAGIFWQNLRANIGQPVITAKIQPILRPYICGEDQQAHIGVTSRDPYFFALPFEL